VRVKVVADLASDLPIATDGVALSEDVRHAH